MSVSSSTVPFRECNCNDAELDRLRQLVAAGVDQRTASLMVWAPDDPTLTPTFGDTPATWSQWIRIEVRRIANAARRALGLRELAEVPGVPS